MINKNFNEFNLSSGIIEGLTALGYITPTRVQAGVIPIVLREQDLIVKSQTGSGKTAAFGIPLCEKMDVISQLPQAIVLAPTRELALQVKEEVSKIGRYKAIRCVAVFGKQPVANEVRELKQRVHIVVGTPGRMLDHITNSRIDVSEIKYVVIDEADKMLSMGFIEQVEAILNKLNENRTTLLFSATIPVEIEELSKKYMITPQKIEVESTEQSKHNISERLYEVSENEKFSLLSSIIYNENVVNSIVFLNTREAVDKLTQKMKLAGFDVQALHGGLEQKDRISVINDFKRHKFGFLIATDVAARGIHVDEVTHIFNYDLPPEKEGYVHRIGRTGRAGKKGEAVTFITTYQHKFLEEIEEFIGYKIPRADTQSAIKFSEETIEKYKKNYKGILRKIEKPLKDKKAQTVTKIYIGAGKKKKLRAGDIVGAISNIEGVSAEDIGIIDVQDNISYVDILNNKGNFVIKELSKSKIKGRSIRIQRAADKE